jgi:hypothetical protein
MQSPGLSSQIFKVTEQQAILRYTQDPPIEKTAYSIMQECLGHTHAGVNRLF